MADVILELRQQITSAREAQRWEEVRDLATDLAARVRNEGFGWRALVQACEHLGETERLPEAWTALVEEAKEPLPSAGKLAVHHLEKGHRNRAIHYYELGISAAIETRDFETVENYWLELAAVAPERLEQYQRFAAQLRERKQGDLAALLLGVVKDHVDAKGTPDEKLLLAKELAFSQPGNAGARKQLAQALKGFYKDHDNFDELVAHCGLTGSAPVEQALAQLERELTFDQSECVYHTGWGVGVIRNLDTDRGEITIDFSSKKGHVMSLEMAEKTLQHLDRDDFRSMKATIADALPEHAEKYPAELVRSALKACGKKAAAKQIKELLVETAVPQRKWTGWWNKTTDLLKTDPYVEIVGSGANRRFVLRDRPVSPSDSAARRFDEARKTADKLAVLREYVQEMRESSFDTEMVSEKLAQLASGLNAVPGAAAKVDVLLSIGDIASSAGVDPPEMPDLASLVPDDPTAALKILENLSRKEHKPVWAAAFREKLGDRWLDFVKQIFPNCQETTRDVLAARLDEQDAAALYEAWFAPLTRKPQSNVGLFLWLAREALRGDGVSWTSIEVPMLVDLVIGTLDFAAFRAKTSSRREEKEEMRVHVSLARRILKGASYRAIRKALDGSSVARAARMLAAVKENPGLDEQTRKDIVSLFYEKHPELANAEFDAERAAAEEAALYCLAASLEAKSRQMRQLRDEELPKNARDIEVARGHGDLRENAEYHAARDRRRFLQAQIGDLEAMIHRARVVAPGEVDTTKIGFGTKVVLEDAQSGETEELIVLGPWESNPEANIYSYQTPVVRSITGAALGDTVDLHQGEGTRRMLVASIENALVEEELEEIPL